MKTLSFLLATVLLLLIVDISDAEKSNEEFDEEISKHEGKKGMLIRFWNSMKKAGGHLWKGIANKMVKGIDKVTKYFSENTKEAEEPAKKKV